MDQLTPSFLREHTIGIDQPISTPFGERTLLYADFTASGRSLDFVERAISSQLPLYANTHTEDSYSGRHMTQLLHEAERQIKRSVNAGEDGCVVACGAGSTAAIDRFQHIIGTALAPAVRHLLVHAGVLDEQALARSDERPIVFVGPYEHHSNEITWREGLAEVVSIPLADDGGIDLAFLEDALQRPEYANRPRIGSFSAASNVSGRITPVREIARLLARYDALRCFDYAASAPYVEIDMNPEGDPDAGLDAIFLSPHKLLGGPGSPGLLVFRSSCYDLELGPTIGGGGTVGYVGPDSHDFVEDIEARERAGTPGTLQTLRAALAFQVKAAIGPETIHEREQQMLRRAFEAWEDEPVEILGSPRPEERLGIVSFNVLAGESHLHPKLVTALLDDLFGIQSRAGCSCAGPYGHALLGIDHDQSERYRAAVHDGWEGLKPGWCRVGFHYAMDDTDANYLIEAIRFVARQGARFLPLYRFDPHTGSWQHADAAWDVPSLSLEEALRADYPRPEPLSSTERMRRYRDHLTQAHEIADTLPPIAEQEPYQLEDVPTDLQFFRLLRTNVEEPLEATQALSES